MRLLCSVYSPCFLFVYLHIRLCLVIIPVTWIGLYFSDITEPFTVTIIICSYIERMSFLERTDHRQFEIERSLRMSSGKRWCHIYLAPSGDLCRGITNTNSVTALVLHITECSSSLLTSFVIDLHHAKEDSSCLSGLKPLCFVLLSCLVSKILYDSVWLFQVKIEMHVVATN